MRLISIKRAKEIWEANDGNPGEGLWKLSGEYNKDGDPLLTTIDPLDGLDDMGIYFEPIVINHTYYLFGTEACQELMQENEKSLLRKVKKDEIEYSTFEFIESVTSPRDLLEASDGWFEWSIITKELYEFGAYTDFKPQKNLSKPFFKNSEMKTWYEDYAVRVVTKEFLAHVINHYKTKIISYYNNIYSPTL